MAIPLRFIATVEGNVIAYEVNMKIRKYEDEDRNSLISLWESLFPEDSPHNSPSTVIDQKMDTFLKLISNFTVFLVDMLSVPLKCRVAC